MKELFVTARSRGTGVGKALIQAVARVAVERGHQRVDWTADRTNSGFLSFYSGLGALAQHEKVFYRLRAMRSTSLAARELLTSLSSVAACEAGRSDRSYAWRGQCGYPIAQQ